jgi:hypothetical protein
VHRLWLGLMSEKFDREIGELLDARNKKQQEAEQKQKQREADAKRFSEEWTQILNSVVAPTFESITEALGRRGVTATVGSEGAVLSLQVVLHDHRARGVTPPRISFEPSPFTQSVKVDTSDQSKNMKLIEITAGFIEDTVVAMTRKYLKPEG